MISMKGSEGREWARSSLTKWLYERRSPSCEGVCVYSSVGFSLVRGGDGGEAALLAPSAIHWRASTGTMDFQNAQKGDGGVGWLVGSLSPTDATRERVRETGHWRLLNFKQIRFLTYTSPTGVGARPEQPPPTLPCSRERYRTTNWPGDLLRFISFHLRYISPTMSRRIIPPAQ